MKIEAQNGLEIHGTSVDTEKLEFNFVAGDEEKAVQTHDKRQRHRSKQQPTMQAVQEREEEDGRKGEKRKEERRKEIREARETVRGRESEKVDEERGHQEEEVAENLTNCVTEKRKRRSKSRKKVRIFVKLHGSETCLTGVSLRDKVGHIARRIRSSACCSQCEVNLTCEGRVLGRSAGLRSSGVKDGSVVQVVRRMRGGGRHKGQ